MIDQDFDKCIQICKDLDIHDYISKLKDGYDTVLTANGANIDLNVKILLGVARALIKDGKILIFDDVFNLLNKKSVDNIMRLLCERKNTHTTLIFSNEESILEQSDQVIAIDHSKVIGSGTHKKLLSENKIYQEIVSK